MSPPGVKVMTSTPAAALRLCRIVGLSAKSLWLTSAAAFATCASTRDSSARAVTDTATYDVARTTASATNAKGMTIR